MMEAVQILGSIAHRFDVVLANPGQPVRETADIILGPKDGLMIKVNARRPLSSAPTAAASRL